MVNKKGWLRIVEASISVILILGALLFLMQAKQTSQERDLSPQILPLLDEIAKNTSLREKIVMYDSDPIQVDNDINKFILRMIDESSIGYDFRICPPEDVCPLLDVDPQILEDVYVGERIITSTIETYGPKKLKIFLWNK